MILAAVGDGPGVVPGLEDGSNGQLQLFQDILGKFPAGLGRHQFLVTGYHLFQHFIGKLMVILNLAGFLPGPENFFKFLLGNIQDNVTEHVDQATVAIKGKPPVSGLPGQAFNRPVIKAQVEDGIHHSGHAELGSRPDRNQKGVGRVAELQPGGFFQPLQGSHHLLLHVLRDLVPCLEEQVADLGGNGKAGRNRKADAGHLGQVGTLAAENVLHILVAFSHAGSEEINVFFCHNTHSF